MKAAQTSSTSSAKVGTTGRGNGTGIDTPVHSVFVLKSPELRTPLTSRAIARAMDKTIEEVPSTWSPIG